MAVEDALSAQGWPVGAVCGPETVLAENFGVSVRILRQAFRILESRGVCRPQRGRSGGLIVLRPDRAATASAMANYLRWTGVSREELWQARRVIEPLAAREAATSSSQGACPTTDQPVADLCGPFLALALTCLNQFEGGADERDPGLGAPLRLAIQAGDSDKAERLAREAVDWRARLARSHAPGPASPRAPIGSNLAAVAAARIGETIGHQACRDGERLGSVWELCERYSVSPGVMTEAVRILEDAGVAQCVKGRAGGVHLRTPSPASVLTTVHGYLAARTRSGRREDTLGFGLNIVAAKQAARTCSVGDALALGQALCDLEERPDAAVMQGWYDIQRRLYDIAGNRVLHLLTICFSAFAVRHYGFAQRPPGAHFADHIRRATRMTVQGVLSGDAARASEGQRAAQRGIIPDFAPATAELTLA
jgi:DNA-binding FadR family transcriptional regulator